MAEAPAPLVPLLAAMSALVGWLHEAKVPGVVIGGVAGWVRDFAEALEAPELLQEVGRRLRPTPRQGGGQ